MHIIKRPLNLFSILVSLLLMGCLAEQEPPLPTVVLPTRDASGTAADIVIATATIAEDTLSLQTVDETADTMDTTGESTEPAATPTLALTQTPEPTATPPEPIASQPIMQASSSTLPAISRDLLFIGSGALHKWNHRTSQVEQLINVGSRASNLEEPQSELVGLVTDFVVTADGKRTLVARRTATLIETTTRITSDDTEEEVEVPISVHELIFVDTVSGAQWLLVSNIIGLESMGISPNADWVSFEASQVADNVQQVETVTGENLKAVQTNLFLLQTGGGSNPSNLREIAACALSCTAQIWHNDSNLFVWGDEEGLKLFNIAGSKPEVLWQKEAWSSFEDTIGTVPTAWAKSGRFVQVHLLEMQQFGEAVFDVATRTMLNFPSPTITSPHAEYLIPELLWMPDDRLLMVTADSTASLWRIQPENNVIVPEESFSLTTQPNVAVSAIHQENGRFAYAIVSNDPDTAGLYHLTSFSQQPEKVHSIPAATDLDFARLTHTITWSTDGFGAIITFQQLPYFGSINEEVLWDMSAVFGTNAHQFHWLPAIPLP